jgi:hypothetical protein
VDDEKYLKHRQKKLDKHYSIIVNGNKVKILNYKFNEYIDKVTNDKISTIQLITKISNDVFYSKKIECTICKGNEDIQLTGTFSSALQAVSLFRYTYKIESLYQSGHKVEHE